MSGVFVPRWRTRPAPVDFGCPPGTNPTNPNKPPETPCSGFSGAFRGSVPNLTAPPALAVVVCFSCQGVDFWQGTGALVCRRCHPPAPGAEVPTFKKSTSGPDDPVQIDAGSTPGGAR